MRVTKLLLTSSLVAALALFAQVASAGFGTPLAEGFWFMQNTNDPNGNTCEVGANGNQFATFGSIFGTAQATNVEIDYRTVQPTSVSRNKSTIKANQNSYGYLNVLFNGTTISGGLIPIQNCHINGSVNTTASTPKGSTSVSCGGHDITQVIGANDASLIEAAFTGRKNIKFKVNVNNGKWSLSIKCKGNASLD